MVTTDDKSLLKGARKENEKTVELNQNIGKCGYNDTSETSLTANGVILVDEMYNKPLTNFDPELAGEIKVGAAEIRTISGNILYV